MLFVQNGHFDQKAIVDLRTPFNRATCTLYHGATKGTCTIEIGQSQLELHSKLAIKTVNMYKLLHVVAHLLE